MAMAFASIHVPEFWVQAVLRSETELRGCAIALVDGTPPIWNVVAANDAALEMGIEIGMARAQAEQFLRVQIRQRSPAQEKAAHAALLDAGWSFSPQLEDTAPDTIVVDLAGLAPLFGSDETIARKLAARAADVGLAANVGVAENAEVAIQASRGFPGVTVIPAGEEARRLGVLPVSVLSPSIEIQETLERWGIRTCAALAALPPLELSTRLGQEGVRLQKLARGASERSLAIAEADFFFEEEMELDDHAAELEPLSFLLGRLIKQLSARLAARSLAFQTIRLQCELEPAFEKDFQISGEAERTKATAKTYEKVLTLPVAMRDSQMLLNLLRLQLQKDPPPAAIQKLRMAAEPARPRSMQGGLFLPSSPDPEKLELTVARLAKLVGDANIGSPQLADTHRPDEFRMKRFEPPREEEKRRTKRVRGETTATESGKEIGAQQNLAAFRLFRPAVPAQVELRGARPVRVSFRGMAGDVVTASGPWRTSGDWWLADAWQQDEWDLEIRFRDAAKNAARFQNGPKQFHHSDAEDTEKNKVHGIYRFFYDSIRQGWFVRGIYD
jgi:protein ImuB